MHTLPATRKLTAFTGQAISILQRLTREVAVLLRVEGPARSRRAPYRRHSDWQKSAFFGAAADAGEFNSLQRAEQLEDGARFLARLLLLHDDSCIDLTVIAANAGHVAERND